MEPDIEKHEGAQRMALCTDSESAVVDAVDQSACEVFQMMAGIELESSSDGSIDPHDADFADKAFTVVMRLSGDLQGTLSLTVSEKLASEWTHRLLGTESNPSEETLIDAVGEMGNMVVGGAKRRLTDFDLTMSLPCVSASGPWMPDTASPRQLNYEFDEHRLTVLINLG